MKVSKNLGQILDVLTIILVIVLLLKSDSVTIMAEVKTGKPNNKIGIMFQEQNKLLKEKIFNSRNNKKENSLNSIKKVKQRQNPKKPTKKASKKRSKNNKTTNEYNGYELYLMSHLIYGESGNCSDKLQRYVASVVINRVNSEAFPDTIEGVVFQDGQYQCTVDGNFYKEVNEQAVNNAKYILKHGSILPDYVLYQSEFLQADFLYEQVENMFFCY